MNIFIVWNRCFLIIVQLKAYLRKHIFQSITISLHLIDFKFNEFDLFDFTWKKLILQKNNIFSWGSTQNHYRCTPNVDHSHRIYHPTLLFQNWYSIGPYSMKYAILDEKHFAHHSSRRWFFDIVYTWPLLCVK